MQKNAEFNIAITDLTTSGSGVGRHDGMVVFVNDALPGEEVRVHIIKVKKNYAVGKLLEVVRPSPLRVKPLCPVFGRCGGCTLQDLAYSGQLSYKHDRVEDALKHLGGIDTDITYPLPSRQQWHYRNKAAYALEEHDGRVDIGFYALHSHQVVDIADCPIQPEYTKLILSQLRVWIEKSGVSIYNEAAGEGLLRRIVLRCNSSGEYMMILVINGEDIPARKLLLQLFRLALPQVRSIILNINQERTNVILGSQNETILGPDHLFEQFGSLRFRFGPNSFLQVNHEQAENMYAWLMRAADIDSRDIVADLYCGVGTISLLAAQQAKAVIGIEEVEEAVENARFNALLNGCENARFECGDAAVILPELVEEGLAPDVVLVDPPRKGLAPELVSSLCELSPRRIGYVSCDPATLARDLRLLHAAGYHIENLQSFDLFPQTTHIETAAVLSKAVSSEAPCMQESLQ